MLTELATHMEPTVSVVPDGATVAVLGLGYVGLPVALTCAEAGFHVVGIDSDPERVRVLRDAAVDGPQVFPLSGALRAGNLAVTHDPASLGRADAVFICVPTPLEEGEARHEAVRACAAAFARHGRPDALVILESTVRPGFVDELRALLGHGGRVALAYAPERIDPQRSQEGMPLREIPRLVAGVNDSAQARATTLLRAMGVAVHPVPLRVAEYAKLLENSYRLLNVAFIDEFAALCRAEGIDPRAVIEAAATKPFGFQPFWPGVGAGGHCVAVDPAFLTHRGRAKGQPLALLEGALHANARRPRAVAAAVAADTEPDDAVLAVGLTYKAGVADTRESAAVAAARALAGMNRRVLTFDSLVEPPDDLEAVSLAEGLRRARAVVLLVPQPEAVIKALAASGLTLFDATGTLPGAVGV
ncbi:MAG TPA: nucleotide sugar dehydrogenase [Myxococcota bacterium]|nr:nucleotide sugar dehydrogenase [Myxococcota bacterium]